MAKLNLHLLRELSGVGIISGFFDLPPETAFTLQSFYQKSSYMSYLHFMQSCMEYKGYVHLSKLLESVGREQKAQRQELK